MLLIGSAALNVWDKGILNRKPCDLDFVTDIDTYECFRAALPQGNIASFGPIQDAKKMVIELRDGMVMEFEIAWQGTTAAALLDLVPKDVQTGIIDARRLIKTGFQHILVASPGLCYVLKQSHKFLKDSPHFLKTMRDIQALERSTTVSISPFYEQWFKARQAETYNYKHPNLSQSKKSFFSGDQVTYVYDHDSIHVAMAIYGSPAYTYFKKDGADVAVDRQKWEALPLDIKLASVLEETYVLALERSQIPFKGLKTPRWSFEKALMKVCTSITSGWWRDFAYNHYDQVLARYDETYVDRFWLGVSAGTVKLAA